MPDIQSQVIRGHLQNVSFRFRDAELVGDQVYPILDLKAPKAKLMRFNRGDQFRDEVVARARGTEAAVADWKMDTVNVDTVQYAVKHRVTDEDVRDAGLPDGSSPPVDLVQEALIRNARKLDLRREVAVANSVFGATWADTTSGGKDIQGGWAPTDSTNTFLSDVSAAKKQFVKDGVGTAKLRLLVDYATMEALKRVAEIRDQLKYTSQQSLDADTLARLLGIEKVIVAQAIKSTAKETKAGTDFTSVNIWEKNAGKGSAFLYHFPGTPGINTMAAGYQPRMRMPNGEWRLSKSYRREELSAWEYESQEEVGVQIVAAQCGYLMVDTILT